MSYISLSILHNTHAFYEPEKVVSLTKQHNAEFESFPKSEVLVFYCISCPKYVRGQRSQKLSASINCLFVHVFWKHEVAI